MCPKKVESYLDPIPDDGVALYVTPSQVDVMIKAGIWPKPSVNGGRCVIDVITCLTYITPRHPDFKEMVEAWGGDDEKQNFLEWRRRRDHIVAGLRAELENCGAIEPRAEDFGFGVKVIR